MASDFVSRFAPHLALPAIDQVPDAGMPGPDDNHPYDSSGTPLPYQQLQDGTRKYFGTAAPQGAPIGPQPSVTPSDGLRGTQPAQGSFNFTQPPLPIRGTTPAAGGLHDTPIDAHEGDDLRGLTAQTDVFSSPQDVLGGRRYTPGTPLAIPPLDPRTAQDRIVAGIRNGKIDPITPDVIARHLPGQGGTLEDLLSHFNFQIPSLNGPNRSRATAPIPRAAINSTPAGTGTVTPVSQNVTGPAADIEALLRQSGLRLTSEAGVRTRNALAGDHPRGYGIDVPPDELEEAVRIIRADPRFRDTPLRPMYIRKGQRFGNGVVATGNHYHIHIGSVPQQ